jgi:hypothetical protein
VSALEGGYRIQGGVVSAFSRSVAAHVRALKEDNHQVGAFFWPAKLAFARIDGSRSTTTHAFRRLYRGRIEGDGRNFGGGGWVADLLSVLTFEPL